MVTEYLVKYEDLSDEIKSRMDWEGVGRKTYYDNKLPVYILIERMAQTLHIHVSDVTVSFHDRYNIYKPPVIGANLYHSERGYAKIDYDGMSLEDVVKIIDSDIYKDTFGPTDTQLDGDRRVVFERRKVDSGVRASIGREKLRWYSWSSALLAEIRVWPINKENMSVLTNVMNTLEEEFEDHILKI